MSKKRCCSTITVGGSKLYVLIDVEEDAWDFRLSDGKQAWSGKVTMSDLTTMAAEISHDLDKFVEQFESAFQLSSKDLMTYQYKMTSVGEDNFKLFWSNFLPKEEISYNLGHIQLKAASLDDLSSVHSAMFDTLLDINDKLRAQCSDLTKENEGERNVSNVALKKLEEFVSLQVQSEKTLYSNFVDVLNEKKRRIRELSDQCDSLQAQLDSLDKPKAEAKPKQSTSNNKPKTTQRRKQSTKVSACTKSKSVASLPPSAKPVVYDSDTEEDEIIGTSSTAVKHARPLIQTDDDLTDVDLEEDNSSNIVSTKQQTIKTNTEQPNLEDATKLGSIDEQKVTSTATADSRTASDVLDDLLGDDALIATTRKPSPVKRTKMTNSETQEKKKPNVKVPKSMDRRLTKEESSLLDDLL